MEVKTKILFLVSFFIVFTVMSVSAQLLMPHQFYGTATFNGAAYEGIKVEAYYGNSVIKTTFSQSGGFYNLKVPDPDDIKERETIKFYLNGVDTGQTYNFFNGESTKLDLSATGAPPSQPPTGGSGGGGGGGSSGGGSSGGGGSSTTTATAKTTTTTSTTSTTTGSQNTGTGNETQPETTPINENKGFAGITGAFTGVVGSPLGIGVLIFILAIVAVSIYAFIMRKRAGK